MKQFFISIALSFVYCLAVAQQGTTVDSMRIWPSAPNPQSTIFLIADWHSIENSSMASQTITTSNGNIMIDKCIVPHGPGALTNIYQDSISLGQLPAGTYTIVFWPKSAFISTGNSCANALAVANDSDTLTFNVAVTTLQTVEQLNSTKISLSPNPARHFTFLNAESGNSLNGPVSVFNIIGEEVWKGNGIGQNLQIPLDHFNPGVYQVRYFTANGPGGIRLIVE